MGYRKKIHTSLLSPLGTFHFYAFSSSSYSSPSPIASAQNPSTWSRVTETKGETTIEHISDFIAALASRGKSWKIKLFPKPVERLAKTSLPRARFIRHSWFLEIAHASRARHLSDWQDPPECWQYCQNWPIRGYSSSCYTRRGSLKKFLQALPPRLALVLPRFFSLVFACPQLPRAWNRLQEGKKEVTLTSGILFANRHVRVNSLHGTTFD